MTKEEAEKVKNSLINKRAKQRGTNIINHITKVTIIVNKTKKLYDLRIQITDENNGSITIDKHHKFNELYSLI